MLNGYHLQNRVHAYKVVDKEPSLPEVALGIGFAENMSPYHLKIIQEHNDQKVTIPALDELPVEQATIDQQGQIFNENDFPKGHFLGSSIGGF